ncbi:MAG: nucleoside phosphorylase, partial [Oscillospiraceae bacterium]|nr:nucleoside phosphorylase [Oscillospiraceae bacterium]
MSILDSFDPYSEAIISPATLRPPVEGFPEVFIMTFKDKSLKILQEIARTEVVITTRAGWDIPHYRFRWNGRELGAFQTVQGGAGTASLLEEAISMGAKKILIYGSCGALDAWLTAGHFIIPTQAYRDEGTSYHYLPVGDYVDIPTAERLGEIFDELDLPYVKGRTWTTDAVFRETRNNMEKRKADGCIAVEMEC